MGRLLLVEKGSTLSASLGSYHKNEPQSQIRNARCRSFTTSPGTGYKARYFATRKPNVKGAGNRPKTKRYRLCRKCVAIVGPGPFG